MVFASIPVWSVIRLAARPVGAASRSHAPLGGEDAQDGVEQRRLADAGPPVMTAAFERRTVSIAARWDAANVFPVFFSTQGTAFAMSIVGQGGDPLERASRRSAMPRSARCRPRRNTQGRSSIASVTTSPSASSSVSALRTMRSSTSSNVTVSLTSSSTGRPQWPSSIAS